MKFAFVSLMMFFGVPTFASASIADGHYSGRCDQLTAVQDFKDGKAVSAMRPSFFVYQVDLVVSDGGKLRLQKLSEVGGTFKAEISERVEMLSATVERRTDINEKFVSDYLIAGDGGMKRIRSFDRDGTLLKTDGPMIEFPAAAGAWITIDLGDSRGLIRKKKLSGAWIATARTSCRYELL